MNTVRAFATLSNLSDNRPNTTALFGELSPVAQTYSKNRQSFSRSGQPDSLLDVFSCRNDQDAEIQMPVTASEKPLSVIQFVYNEFINSRIPTNSQKANFVTAIGSTISGLTNVEIGTLLPGNSSTQNMPDYVRFNYIDGSKDYAIRIWFADSAFADYDLFQITIVSPVNALSSLAGSFISVTNALAATTVNQVLTNVTAAIGSYPATVVKPYIVQWSDPTDRTKTIDISWTIVGYGPQANEEEVIRGAIRDYLSTNGTGVNWGNYFLGLYSSNEFTHVPIWNAVSPVGAPTDNGAYASMLLVNTLRGLASTRLPSEYESLANLTNYLNLNLAVVATSYRAVSLLSVGHPANAGNKFRLSDIHPSYLAVPTSSTDYGRMTVPTQNFAAMLNQALDLARNYEVGDSLPSGFTRYNSGGRTFIAFSIDGYRHLVLTRNTFTTETGV